MAVAEKNSPALAAMRSQVATTSAKSLSAKAEFAPKLSANSFASDGTYRSILSSSPGVMPPFWLGVPNGRAFDENLMLMFPLFTGGLKDATVRSANWQERANQADLAELQADVSLSVQDAYFKALVAKEMVAVEESKLTAARELLNTEQAKLRAGKEIEAAVQRVQAELARAHRSLTSRRNDEAKALLDLDAAMGADFSSSFELAGALTLGPDPAALKSYLARAQKSRGRILAARALVESSSAEIRKVESQRSPQIYGQAMADFTGARTGSGITLALTLSIPIFDGGEINSEVSAAKAQRAKVLAALKEATISTENEVRHAWLDVQSAGANAVSAEASVKAAQAAYDVIALRVAAGKGILVEQLDALETLTESKADLAEAIYEHNIAIAQLDRAAGGAQ